MGSYGRGSFGGFGGGGAGQMQQLMQQAKKMQEELQKAKAEINETVIEGVSGSGMVKVTMDGAKSISAVKIDPSIIDPEDPEMLEDLILAAINDGYSKADKLNEEKLGKFNLPSGII